MVIVCRQRAVVLVGVRHDPCEHLTADSDWFPPAVVHSIMLKAAVTVVKIYFMLTECRLKHGAAVALTLISVFGHTVHHKT
jgi:predicted nicotinamide N-methyase